MSNEELSNEFDVLLKQYAPVQNSGDNMPYITLDEYEKSVFLTSAQEQIAVELYTGRNIKVSSFEETEELRSNLRNLIKTANISESTESYTGISEYSKFFILPKDTLFITYEQAHINDSSAKCMDGKYISVIPVIQDDFNKIIKNPFRGITNRRALRLDTGSTNNNEGIVEIISKYKIDYYTVRYLSKPSPIVLINLTDLSINGETKITECKLDSGLHRPILERAVALAIASKSS